MSMLFKRIKDWARSITTFRTGDVIPVDGPSGTAKMSKDDLLRMAAENAQQEVIDVLPESMQSEATSVEQIVWEQGTINGTTGANESAVNRLRTKDYLNANYVHKIQFTSNTITTLIRGYDENKNLVGNYGFDGVFLVQSDIQWSTNEPYDVDFSRFPSVKYFRIIQTDSDYEPILPSDNRITISLVTKSLNGKTFDEVFQDFSKEIHWDNSLISVQRSTNRNDNYTIPISFELGTINSSGVEESSYIRVRSNFFRCRKDTVLTFENASDTDGMFVVVYDDKKNFVSNSDTYVTRVVITDDCFVRVRGKSADNSLITNPSVYNFDVVVQNFGAKNFDDMGLKTCGVVQHLKFFFSGVKPGSGVLQHLDPIGSRAITDYVYLEKGMHIQIDTDWDRFMTGKDNGLMLLKYGTDKSFLSYIDYKESHIIETSGWYRVYLKTKSGEILTQSDLDAIHLYPAKYWNIAYGCGSTKLIKSDTFANPQEQNILSRYDALVTAYPDNVSRNLLGYATAAGGGGDTDLPIYEYVFQVDGKPTMHGYLKEVYDAPTILLTTLVHGNESCGARSLLRLFEKMMSATEGELLSMRSGINFKVIPIVNPYGYANNTRNNARNVNINRNFAPFFSMSTDADKGDSAYSENESLIVHNWMTANKGCFAYFDIHDSYVDTTGTRSYQWSANLSLGRSFSSLIRSLSSLWRKNYNFASSNPAKVLGYVEHPLYGGTFNEAFFAQKILNSALFEVGVAASDNAMYAGYELVVNYLNMIVSKSWTD